MFIDLFLLWMISLFNSRGSAVAAAQRSQTQRNVEADWVILDDLASNGRLQDRESNDPFLNQEYDDGPDWDC